MIVVVIVFYKSCSQVKWENVEFTNISITCRVLQVHIILCAKCSPCVILRSRSRLTTMRWRSVMPFSWLHLSGGLIGALICIVIHAFTHARAFSLAVSHTARVTIAEQCAQTISVKHVTLLMCLTEKSRGVGKEKTRAREVARKSSNKYKVA